MLTLLRFDCKFRDAYHGKLNDSKILVCIAHKVFIAILLLCNVDGSRCHGEGLVSGSWTITTSSDGTRVYIGPDPSVPVDLLQVLHDRQVQIDLKLSREQIHGLLSLDVRRRDLNRQNSIDFKKMEEQEEQLRQELKRDVGQQDAVRAELDQIADERNGLIAICKQMVFDGIEEVLTPPQLTRLHQLVFRIEIALVGYSHALTLGRLRERVGILDGQREHLAARITEIAKESQLRQREIRARYSRNIISLLSDNERLEFNKQVGAPVEVRSEMVEQRSLRDILDKISRMKQQTGDGASWNRNEETLNGVIRVTNNFGRVGNPENRAHLVGLLNNSDVQREIGLTRSSIDELNRIQAQTQSELKRISELIKSGNPLDSAIRSRVMTIQQESLDQRYGLLDSSQKTRLRELSAQIEIAIVGLTVALTDGFVGKGIAITEGTKEKIRKSAFAFKEEMDKELQELGESAEEAIHHELSTEQRVKVRDALGASFRYSLRPAFEIAMDWRADQKEMAEEKSVEKQKN